jgi:hypothetical protein
MYEESLIQNMLLLSAKMRTQVHRKCLLDVWFLVALQFDPLLLNLGLKVCLVGRNILHVVHQLVGLLHHTADRLLQA